MHFFDRLRVPAASEAVGADSISARGVVPAAELHGRIWNAPLRVFYT